MLLKKDQKIIERFRRMINEKSTYKTGTLFSVVDCILSKNKEIKRLTSKHKTPFYIFDKQLLDKSIDYFMDAFERFYNTEKKDHFFTISESEKNQVLTLLGWRGEGVGWFAFSSQKNETFPVHRLYNGKNHFYTRSLNEKNNLVNVGWRYEGIAFYAYPSP